MKNTIFEVQRLSLSLLQVFVSICQDYHLQYYFTGGALIGVLRHKGFIPWDDDIDIGMPRKDYECFLEIMEKKPIKGYGICNRHTNKNWYFAMSQFIDEESEVEINLVEKKRIAHIWIDVFPLDGLPSNAFLRWLRIKHILFIRYLIQIAHISTQVDSHRDRPFYEKAAIGFFKIVPIGRFFDTDKLLDKLEEVLKRKDFYRAEYVGNLLGRYREREVVPSKYFGTSQQAEFEGLLVNIPENSHALQTALYGDYMELPPEEKRETHNVRILKSRML